MLGTREAAGGLSLPVVIELFIIDFSAELLEEFTVSSPRFKGQTVTNYYSCKYANGVILRVIQVISYLSDNSFKSPFLTHKITAMPHPVE